MGRFSRSLEKRLAGFEVVDRQSHAQLCEPVKPIRHVTRQGRLGEFQYEEAGGESTRRNDVFDLIDEPAPLELQGRIR